MLDTSPEAVASDFTSIPFGVLLNDTCLLFVIVMLLFWLILITRVLLC